MSSPPVLFLYEPRTVRIDGVSPNAGLSAGGESVIVYGVGFLGIATGATTVDIGGSSATVVASSDSEVSITTPAHAEGLVDVVVTNSDGDSATLAGGFTYKDLPLPIDVIFRTPAGAVARLARVENSQARISQALGQPASMSFTSPLEPKGFTPISWRSFGVLLFDGVISKASVRTEGEKKTSVWDVSSVQYAGLLSKRFPVGEWTATDASLVISQLMATWGTGFSSQIEAALGEVTEKLDGSRDLWTVITGICEKVGAKCFVASLTLIVYSDLCTFEPPDDVTDDNTDLLWPDNGQAVTLEQDFWQIINYCTCYGADGVQAVAQDASSIAEFGICPFPLYDNTLTTVDECLARAKEPVKAQAFPIPTAKYSTRDLKSMAGKSVHIDVSAPDISGDFIIVSVEIDQLELLAVNKKPRFSCTCVPSWAPAMKRGSSPDTRLLQQASDIIGDQNKQARMTGDVSAEPGGPTIINPRTITNTHIAGCITNDKMQPAPVKDPVVTVSTINIVLAGLPTVGGVVLQEGDRVLVIDQTDPTENGVYIASAASGLWQRASDSNSSAKMPPGIIVDVASGTDAGIYVMVATAPVTLGTSALSFKRLLFADGSVPFTGDQSMGAHKLTNLTDPSSAQDAATKNYVDAAASGLQWKASVRAATTANITLSGAQTIDGVAVIAGNRVLVKDQSTGANNGIYVAAAGGWTRAADFDANAEVKAGAAMVVDEGTTNGDKFFILTTNDPIVVGTTALVFAGVSGGGTGDIKSDGSVPFAADQSMGTHKLTSVTDPTSAQDAATKHYVDSVATTVVRPDGSVPFTADQSMGVHKLTNVTDPASAQDAATKNYVDVNLGDLSTQVYRSTNQTLTHNVEAAISFSAAQFDADSKWAVSPNPTRVTIQTAGKYQFLGQIKLGTGFAGVAHLRLYKNGTQISEASRVGADLASGNEYAQVAWFGSLAATDYLELKVLLELAAGSGTFDVVGSDATTTTLTCFKGGGGAAGAAGKVVQVVNSETGATANGTNGIPIDDTIPQNTEGDQYLSLAITPSSALNKLLIEVTLFCAGGANDTWLIAALFQDTTANALAAGAVVADVAFRVEEIRFAHYMVAGTTSATTFKVRAGKHVGAAGTFVVNGNNGGRLLGGVMASSITITELSP